MHVDFRLARSFLRIDWQRLKAAAKCHAVSFGRGSGHSPVGQRAMQRQPRGHLPRAGFISSTSSD